MARLRIVKTMFEAAHLGAERPRRERFHKGEELIILEDDGHTIFIRASDKSAQTEFIVANEILEKHTTQISSG
jgi:hypothetical protein